MGAGRRRYRLLLLPLAVALPMLICFALFVYANDKFSNRHKTVEFRQTVRHRETKEDLPEAVGRPAHARIPIILHEIRLAFLKQDDQKLHVLENLVNKGVIFS